MKLLTNPILLRVCFGLFAAAVALVFGIFAVRAVRRNVQEEASFEPEISSRADFPLQTYHAVIQQLKQQKYELENLQQVDRRRTKALENLSSAVLSNLSCGVLFFHTNGLVRQANAAVKQILGFSSPVGMNAGDLFRHAVIHGSSVDASGAMTVAEAVETTIQHAAAIRRIDSDYTTPAGEERVLEITLSPVHSAHGELLGVTCLVNDTTEIAYMRRREELSVEMSAEMALQLRNSLGTIFAQANKLAVARDTAATEQLALDIAAEIRHLDRTIGGFLAGSATAAASGVN